MNPAKSHSTPRHGIALPLAVLALCAWNALPSLGAAWGNDLYARGAAAAFTIWLLSQCVVVLGKPGPRATPNAAWITAALVLCAAGSMSGMRALQHLALAAALPGLLGSGFTGIASVAAAATWLPASGWILSHIEKGGLKGWERPSAAIVFALVFAFLSRRHPAVTSPVHP